MTELDTTNGGVMIKIAAITAEIGAVGTDAKHHYHGYKYLTKDGLFEALKPHFRAHNLAIVPEVEDWTHETVKTRQGQEFLVFCRMVFHVSDGKETLIFGWIGVGQDAGPQCTAKAVANGIKTWLSNTFQIPIDDATQSQPQSQQQQQRQQRQQQNGKRPPNVDPHEITRAIEHMNNALSHLGLESLHAGIPLTSRADVLLKARAEVRSVLMRAMFVRRYGEMDFTEMQQHDAWKRLLAFRDGELAETALGLKPAEAKPEAKPE